MSGNLSLASANVPSRTTPKGYGGWSDDIDVRARQGGGGYSPYLLCFIDLISSRLPPQCVSGPFESVKCFWRAQRVTLALHINGIVLAKSGTLNNDLSSHTHSRALQPDATVASVIFLMRVRGSSTGLMHCYPAFCWQLMLLTENEMAPFSDIVHKTTGSALSVWLDVLLPPNRPLIEPEPWVGHICCL